MRNVIVVRAILALAAAAGAVSPDIARGLVIRAVAIDRDTPSRLVVAVSGTGLIRSVDSGRTWASAGPGIVGEVWAMTSAGSGVFFAATDSGVYRSLDGAATWSRVFAGGPDYSIAAAPSSDLVVYAAGPQGLVRSFDRGETWTPGGLGLPAGSQFLGVDAASASIAYAVSGAGLFRTEDAGASWVQTPFPLPVFGIGGVLTAAFDPRRTGTLYVSHVICAFGCITRLLSTSDGGQTQGEILASSRIPSVSVDDASVLFASTLSELRRSRDGGATFETVGAEIPIESGASPFPIPILVSSPRSPLTIAATSTGQLWATEDRGTTWRRLAEPGALCDPSPGVLCLGAGRFRVTAEFRAGDTVPASAFPVAITSDAGAFWFFSPNNLEVVVKIVDGRAFNDRFWVFIAGLSDVAYTVAVTDLETGAIRSYVNAPGELASRSDTNAF